MDNRNKCSDNERRLNMYYKAAADWLHLKNKSIPLENYFIDNGIKNIAIYGMGVFGKRFYEEIRSSRSVSVAYAIDGNDADRKSWFIDLDLKRELEDDNSIEAIVVTPFHDFETIRSKLNTDLLIVGLDEIIAYLNTPVMEITDLLSAEIEIFSYCNRVCWFCSNSVVDRHSKNVYMPEELYLNILNQLASINKRIQINFSRYNEPLADQQVLLKRVKQAREILPESMLHTNTNGDYITPDYIDKLCGAGLNSLHIQFYLSEDKPFDISAIKESIKKAVGKLGMEYTTYVDEEDYYGVILAHKKMTIKMYARNFRTNGCTRGNSVESIKPITRNRVCLEPNNRIFIDHNGAMMPCCNLRSDLEKHKLFIMGNLNDNTIAEIFNNEKYIALRRQLGRENIKISPCKDCAF